ncbi:MAG: tetraacyldisaccharide 4'-kinase [Bacteroidales bacterium]|nr:tetraacyldisaccharide 4'-kinase [Bacteroidales bacterium]
MIDKILLFPYWLSLKVRHFMFDCGLRKVHRTSVPSICVGNITVGGTGKTPHTEMLLRTLLEDEDWAYRNIAVLSRGYKRKSKGFQQVTLDGTASEYGDEPLQIKKKFPIVTVAVDKSRRQGCEFLCNPDLLKTSKKAKRCKDRNFPKADLIILDDAFQHRSVKASASIVLVDYNRPIFRDHLLPLGRLRDLPERISAADIVIVSKCPADLNAWEKGQWAEALGIRMYDAAECAGRRADGKKQYIFFTKIQYDTPQAIFDEGDPRYVYSKRLVLFSGIANDAPLRSFLSDDYKIVRHLKFSDHHNFTWADIKSIEDAAKDYPTAVAMTTEKDCQRVRDCKKLSDNLKLRLFYTPIKSEFLSYEDRQTFTSALMSFLK